MTSNNGITRHRDMRVRIEQFSKIAADMVAELGLEKVGGRGPKAEILSERVVRDYVRRRVLSPTIKDETTGERGLYGYRHLVEFLAARVLLNDGWTLEKIAENNRRADLEALLALLPGSDDRGRALALIQSFRAASAPVVAERRQARSIAEPTAHEVAAQGLPQFAPHGRGELYRLMRELPGGGNGDLPNVRTMLRIEFGPGLALEIDRSRAQSLTPDDADRIGQAVASALHNLPNLPRGKDPR
jgi:hypothetical protein